MILCDEAPLWGWFGHRGLGDLGLGFSSGLGLRLRAMIYVPLVVVALLSPLRGMLKVACKSYYAILVEFVLLCFMCLCALLVRYSLYLWSWL